MDSFETKNVSTDLDQLVECAQLQSDVHLFYTTSMVPAVSSYLYFWNNR